MIKESVKKPATPIVNTDTGLEVKETTFTYVSYLPSLSVEFGRTFQHTSSQIIFKGANTLKSILCTPKINPITN